MESLQEFIERAITTGIETGVRMEERRNMIVDGVGLRILRAPEDVAAAIIGRGMQDDGDDWDAVLAKVRAVMDRDAKPYDEGVPLQTRLRAYEEEPSQYLKDAVESLDAVEREAAGNLFDALVRVRDTMKALILRDFTGRDSGWVNKLNLSKWGPVQDAIGEMLRSGFRAGQLGAREMVRRHTEIGEWREYRVSRSVGIMRMPRKSLEFIKDREIYIASSLKDTLTSEMKNVLMQGIKSNENIEVTVAKITKMFEPLVGDGWSPDQWEIEQPARMQRIIRTNATDTYNHGVLTEFRDPDMLLGIVAIRYAAVMDSRTSEICRYLNGFLFKPLDPRLDKCVPPMHWNCRSILEPIINGRQAPKELFVTDEIVNHALSLAPVDFGGFK